MIFARQAWREFEMNEPQLTPAQQNLMNFFDKLATTPYSSELIQEGYQALDAAVEEHRQLQDSINGASSTSIGKKDDWLSSTD
jgi:hypothetical protein